MSEKMSKYDISKHIKNKERVCLIGGLGVTSLYVGILDSLKKLKIVPKKYILITSPEIQNEFNKLNITNPHQIINDVHALDYQTVLRENYIEVYNMCRNIIESNIRDFEMVCELTGGTKPVSIALTVLAEKFNLLRIYYSGRTLIRI